MACTLRAATDDDVAELRRWFANAAAVNIWGGPKFRYPFTPETFAKDCCLDIMKSFSLVDSAGRMVAFGQYYYRLGRGHLARLITKPDMRRRGYGRELIKKLINAVAAEGKATEVSLFVYRHNQSAYRCYRSLSFCVQDYPDDAPLKEQCYFLTRPIDLPQ
jgi:ribosomal protein S18 acetylase RimI-like enzyme